MKLNWFHYLCLIFDDVYIQLLVCSYICSFQGTIQFAELLQRLGLSGLEPPTSRLSGVRSNRLSYKPIPSGSRLKMETERFELLTPCLQGRCSPN